ncbi:sodium/potassium-transporting ATPase subunit alpha [Drosophila navojoa]|nr:sodium/potassium-transporting ATPase subunit alpha [Drosophila navojoa]
MLCATVICVTLTGLSIPNLLEFYVSLTVSSSPLYFPSLVFIGLWITKNNLTEIGCYVRNMESVSTLGLTTVICSNLLGSMTQRTWQISELFVDGELLNVQSDFDETDHFRHLIRASVLCNQANFAPGQRGLPTNQQALDGTEYEKAVLKFAIRFVESLHVLRVKHKRVAYKSVDFISRLQVSVHVTVNDDDETEYYLYIRGHWAEVMDHCTTCYMENEAEPVELSAELQDEVISHGLQLEKLGRHTYAFASKRLPADDYMLSLISNSFSYSNNKVFFSFMNTYSNSMCFLGLIAAQNPPYPHVIDAIAQCRTAGIKLVFMTRTDVNFASAIARAVGVFEEDSDIADMAETFNMALPRVEHRLVTAVTVNMQNMSTQVHHQRWNIEQLLLSHVDVVFSRIAVSQRYLIIDSCLQLGAVVTAIGSSVHDTSAIRCANVGVSEASSSQVSQSCADIIVLGNNFVTVVRAIAQSRLLFENQKKALVYAMATNMSMVVIHFLFVVLQMPFRMPLVPSIFISIFVNLIPASTLFYEPAEFDLMKVIPRVNEDFLVNRRMLFVSYINVGLLEASAVVLAYIVYMLHNGFLPGALFGLSVRWYDDSLNDMMDSYGQEWTRGARLQLEYEMTSVIVITLTVMQLVNLVISKTARVNLLSHGFGNLRLNLALVYMIGICFLFTFTSAPEQLQSLPVDYLPIFLYVFPLAILTVLLETMRRYILRKYPGSWLEEVSYYGCL